MSIKFLISQSLYSGFNAWALDELGVVQNLGQTIAPSLISAVGLGVIHRGIEKGSITLVDKVKEKLNISDSQSLSKGVDGLHFVFDLASRYAVARVLNAVFGCKISTNYVHIYTALDFIRKSSSLTPFDLAIFGWRYAVYSRIISLFVAVPSFKNSFYFGGIFLGLVYPLELNKPKIHFQVRQRFHIEDPRLLLISHVALNSFILATFLCIIKICNRYFKLQIPRSFMIFIGVVQTIDLLGISLLKHIGDD